MGCIGPSIVVLQFGIFVQIVKCQGETSGASFKWTKHQQTVSTNTPTQQYTPTPSGRLNSIFLSHWGIKRNQMKVAGAFFFLLQSSTIQPLNTKKKKKSKKICVGGRQTKNFGSKWKYFLMSLHVKIHFIWHVHCSPPIYAPRAPFFPIFTSKHQKSILNSMSQSIFQFSPQRDKQKSNSLDPWAVVLSSTFQMTVVASLSSANSTEGGVRVCWGSGSRLRYLSRGQEAGWYTG